LDNEKAQLFQSFRLTNQAKNKDHTANPAQKLVFFVGEVFFQRKKTWG